ncbi:hypothetical protein Hanom_Chr11g00999631 [Helianthus anomalus]
MHVLLLILNTNHVEEPSLFHFVLQVEELKTTASTSERNAYEIFSTRTHSYMVVVFCLLLGAMLDGVEMLTTTA